MAEIEILEQTAYQWVCRECGGTGELEITAEYADEAGGAHECGRAEPEPALIDSTTTGEMQLLVRNAAFGWHKQLQPGETASSGDTPVKYREVRVTTERWLGRAPEGAVYEATAPGEPATSVRVREEYGPWKDYR